MRYPKGEQDFAGIRKEQKVYVDKTAVMYDLIDREKYVFLARPRRFGKSLLLSTIRYYFEGEKDLFKGLAVYELEKDWKSYPVIHLELSGTQANDPDSLKKFLEGELSRYEKKNGIIPDSSDLSFRFSEIVRKIHENNGEKVVVLIDEYDNPLINTIHLPKIHEDNRNLLKSLYSNLKSLDEYIRFAMLTGVSRFSKTSIFSGLNNLTDITFLDRYSSICGFTENEIREFLWEGVKELGEHMELSPEEALEALKWEYDGYHFSKACNDIYNPFSMLHALDHKEISDYWLVSGAPGFLIEKLQQSPMSFFKLFNDKATEQGLTSLDTVFSSPVALLYQTGYLTIKGYDASTRKYSLGIPNREVDRGLFPALLGGFVRLDQDYASDLASEMGDCLKDGNPEEFIIRLRSFLGSVPYNIHPKVSEMFFEHTLYLLFRTIPIDVDAESTTSFGRRDIVVKTDKFIYIFELKLDSTAEQAINQIKEKEYSLPYRFEEKRIFMIGLNFSSKTRNIQDWKTESL